MTDGNDNAFPTEQGMEGYAFMLGGLSKREYFAAMAMQGMAANSRDHLVSADIALIAVKIADALIEALNK